MKNRRVIICVTLIGAAAALSTASPVSAHADLEFSSPAPSATLEDAPRAIVLDFSEPVSLVERSVEVFDENLERIEVTDPVILVADRVEIRELPQLEDGLFLVSWRVQSQDGHIAQGAFTFQIGTGTSTAIAEELLAGLAAQRSGPPGLDAVRGIARAMSYLGLAGALGTLAFAVAAGFRRVRWVIGFGWSAAALGTVLHYLTQGVYVSAGTWSDLVDAQAWSDVSSTRLGQGIILRLGLLFVLGMLVIARSRRRSVDETAWWRSSAVLAGGGIVATFAATGHPSASSPAAVASVIDAVHLVSVLIWIGGLLGIVFGKRDTGTVRTFSRVATVVVPIAVVTGIWQAWHLVDDANDLTATSWGRALLVKTVFVLVAATVGMLARFVIRADADAPIRRLVTVEVVFALVIIAATSTMVASPPRAGIDPSVMTATLAQDDVIANITVTPGIVGANEIHVTVVTPGGTLAPVEGVELRMTREESDIPPVAVDVEVLGPNHFLGRVSILQSGAWNMEILIQVSASRIVRLSTSLMF